MNLCIIPARGGSKRIPKKNIKEFHKKPLIAYSIEVALNSKLFDKVLVSTDSDEIAKVALEFGAVVQMRPNELSDDFTGTWDVVEYVLKTLEKEGEKYDYVCTIYATAPLLQEKYLKKGYEKLKNSDALRAFSVTTMPFPIQRTFKIKNGRCEMFTPEFYSTRSQDLEEAYQDAGQFYWEKRGIKSDDVWFGKDSIPIVLPRHLVQDIDTLEDWEMAEKLYQLAYPNKFDKWNQTKQKADNTPRKIGFKPREIFWIRLGQNIGDEEFGKGNEFQRPILIVRKLTSNLFMGIPLTSKIKEEKEYFYTVSYATKNGSMKNSLMLLQLKTFDKKRLMGRVGKLDIKQFEEVLQKVQKLFIP